MNLRKMILEANFAETVIAKDLMIPNGNMAILGSSESNYFNFRGAIFGQHYRSILGYSS